MLGAPEFVAVRAYGPPAQRHILVAISGGIAAYKGLSSCGCSKASAAVRVVLSERPQNSSPAHHASLSGEPTHTELLDEEAEAGMGHIELARWADLMIIAPATADVIARLAQGRADDLSPPLRSQRLHRLP